MSDTTTLVPEAKGKPRRWIRKITIGVVLVVVVGLLAGWFVVALLDRQGRDVAAELDKSDPGWRFMDIEAARAEAPVRNSAVLIRKLCKAMGPNWPGLELNQMMQESPVLPHRLDEKRLQIMGAELKSLAGVLEESRPLADMPYGRHELAYSFHPLATSFSDQADAKRLISVLDYQAVYLANKGDVTGAVRLGRAGVCVARSLGDEPALISGLLRSSYLSMALRGLERSLSLGEAEESELLALEKILELEAQNNFYLVGTRGERASMQLMFERIGSGALSSKGLNEDLGIPENSWVAKLELYPRWQFRRYRGLMLQMGTKAVTIAQLPVEEQAEREEEHWAEIKQLKETAPVVGNLLGDIRNIGRRYRQQLAQVAAMRSLVAAERYRLKVGKLPGTVTDLVPRYLKEVPRDPFDGKPLRMAKASDCVIFYSVGMDRTDQGGLLDRERPMRVGVDVGYQLWDVTSRRKPALPWNPKKDQ